MLAMITRVAHGAFHAIGKRNFAIGNLEMLKRFQCRALQLREEKQDRQVTVHAADHRLGDGAAGVAFVMSEPADRIPPLILPRAGNPNGIFGQAVKALH